MRKGQAMNVAKTWLRRWEVVKQMENSEISVTHALGNQQRQTPYNTGGEGCDGRMSVEGR